MSAETESFVFDSRGPVHTGTGHQFNGPTFVVDLFERLVRRSPDPRVVAREYLQWLHQRFVEPGHYNRAWELLADHGSVLLTGVPGSGRRATAQILLHRLDTSGAQIRELPDADTGGPSHGPLLAAHAVDSGQRLLLDLSTSDESTSDEKDYRVLLEQLPAYRDVVRECGAHLVVVLPYSRQHHLGSELGLPVVDIVRPEGKRVFQLYLRSDGITFIPAQLDVEELTTQLRSEPMRHIAELAGLVGLARESVPAQTFPHWLHEALAALTKHSDKVATQLTTHRTGQQRALLLTTAMFSGAHADAVFASTSRLCTILQHPADERPRLEREDLAERLAEIGATADNAGQVRFRLLAYDRAVRTHFWTNFPNLRKDFRNWVGTALGHPMLSGPDRDAVVTRFAEQALRTGRPGDLGRLAEHWVRRTGSRGPSHLLPQAARAVERGLSDERHGIFFRRQLYAWSTSPTLPSDLAQVVVQVCSEVLALTHPDQALVRLHHIVRRHSGTAGAAARDALLDLAGRDRRLYRLLLERVTTDPRTTEHAAADLALFLELADPARLTRSEQPTPPLIRDVTVQDHLVAGWRAVLDQPSPPSCVHHVQTWLVACEDERYRELVLTVLVKAGEDRYDVLSRLYVMARDWAHTPSGCREERSKIAAWLNSKIDSALGVGCAELDPGDRTEETLP